MKNPSYVGDFKGANKFGSYIDQTVITGDFCKQNPMSADKAHSMKG